MSRFGGDALQELAPRGYATEEISNLDACSSGTGQLAQLLDPPALPRELGAEWGVWLPRAQAHVGDRRDAGERLAAEAERVHARQVRLVADLARGVAAEGELGVGTAHADTVIRHRDPADPSRRDGDLNLCRFGVQGVLAHLAGRDLVDELVRKYVAAGHEVPPTESPSGRYHGPGIAPISRPCAKFLDSRCT